jgi:ribosomal protein S18 acetylase RimI-like enzyme
METTIRRATPEDYPSICKLLEEIDALHRDHLPERFQKYEGPAREQEYFAGLLNDPGVALFVAEQDGALMGYGHANIAEAPAIPLFVPRRYGVVDEIVVSSACQNRGVGTQLMDSMHNWAREMGATSVELNVYEFNETAIRFYERLGYRTVSRKMSMEPEGWRVTS